MKPEAPARLRWDLALASLAVLVALSEAALALGGASALWRTLGRLELVDRPLLQDQRDSVDSSAAPQRALLLGDSVLYGSALRERRIPAWREASLGAALGRGFAAQGRPSLELSADGLNPCDLEALLNAEGSLAQGPLVLELNVRMLAAEAGDSASAFSRAFLAPTARPDAAERASAASRLFRYCRLANHLLWQPSRRLALEGWLDRALPPPRDADAGDLDGALLAMKIQPYYGAAPMRPEHLGLQALRRLATALSKRNGPVLVFLTPQDGARIAGVVDAPAYAANRAALARAFQVPHLRYRDWSERRLPQGAFLDHCHLDAEGNEVLAGWVLAELSR